MKVYTFTFHLKSSSCISKCNVVKIKIVFSRSPSHFWEVLSSGSSWACAILLKCRRQCRQVRVFVILKMYRTSLFYDHNVLGVQKQNHNALTIIEMLLEVSAQMQQNFTTESKHYVINKQTNASFFLKSKITRCFDQTTQDIHGVFKV